MEKSSLPFLELRLSWACAFCLAGEAGPQKLSSLYSVFSTSQLFANPSAVPSFWQHLLFH